MWFQSILQDRIRRAGPDRKPEFYPVSEDGWVKRLKA